MNDVSDATASFDWGAKFPQAFNEAGLPLKWSLELLGETESILAAVGRQRTAPALRLVSWSDGSAVITTADYLVCGADSHAARF